MMTGAASSSQAAGDRVLKNSATSKALGIKPPPSQMTSKFLRFEQKYIAPIIGKKGETIRGLRRHCDCGLSIDQETKDQGYSTVHIEAATMESIHKCEAEIEEIKKKVDAGVNCVPEWLYADQPSGQQSSSLLDGLAKKGAGRTADILNNVMGLLAQSGVSMDDYVSVLLSSKGKGKKGKKGKLAAYGPLANIDDATKTALLQHLKGINCILSSAILRILLS